MAKVCKSCGSFYKGEYCDKCGYGKPGTRSKELERFKKATPKKPVRFMTEEEIARAGENKSTEQRKPSDPNGRRNLLIVIAILMLGFMIGVLVSRGVLFSNNKEDVIKQYFTALDKNDFDSFIDTLPSEIQDVYTSEQKKMGLGDEAYMAAFKADLEKVYGENLSVSVELGREEHLDREQDSEAFDLSAYKERYGSAPTVRDAYIVHCLVTYSGTLATDTVEYECYVGKVGWKWKIFNMEYSPGILAPEE